MSASEQPVDFVTDRLADGSTYTRLDRLTDGRAISLLKLAEEAWSGGGVVKVLRPDGSSAEVLDMEVGR